jgi:hypothetical protein
VLGWLHRSIEPSDLPTLVAHSLMDAGSKSVSHLERLLDKFHWLLEDVAKEPAAKLRLVGAIAAFWASSTQMTWIVMHKMVRRRLRCTMRRGTGTRAPRIAVGIRRDTGPLHHARFGARERSCPIPHT